MTRKLYLPLAVALASFLFSYVGCDNAQQLLEQIPTDQILNGSNQNSNSGGMIAPTQGTSVAPPTSPYPNASTVSIQQNRIQAAPGTVIRICSFNVQAFGPSKMDDVWIMQHLAAIIQNFDIVAIQEIRSKDQQLMNVLCSYVNQNGAQYNYLLGERLGRTNSKEQYAYVFNTKTIYTTPESSYTVRDDEDLLHREPLVANFSVRVPQGYQPFTFTLANVHTDPDEAAAEVAVLGRVFNAIAGYEANVRREDDVIMVGDFNANARMLAAAATRQEFTPVIVNEMTNVSRTAQYDNLLLDPRYNVEFTGNAGVFDVARVFNLSQAEVKRISDHLPVWAEFSAVELMPRTASLSDQTNLER